MSSFIEIKDLHFSYVNDLEEPPVKTEVLKGINLNIEKGEFVAVLGHNGSGKSTLAKCINAINLPESGAVYVNGMDTLDENNLLPIREKVGMVFQNPDNHAVSGALYGYEFVITTSTQPVEAGKLVRLANNS